MLTTSVSPVDTGVVIPSARQYNEGDTATLIATPAAGTYYYICSLHSGMVGTITIQN
jgi:plastocyanin